MMKHRYFPLYIDISRKDILVAGAGKIALRRIKTLLKFESHITVVGKEVHQELCFLAESTDCIRVIQRQFEPEDLEGRDMVFACTDSRDVNREIVKACRKRGILVNAADRFLFSFGYCDGRDCHRNHWGRAESPSREGDERIFRGDGRNSW